MADRDLCSDQSGYDSHNCKRPKGHRRRHISMHNSSALVTQKSCSGADVDTEPFRALPGPI